MWDEPDSRRVGPSSVHSQISTCSIYTLQFTHVCDAVLLSALASPEFVDRVVAGLVAMTAHKPVIYSVCSHLDC